MKLRALIIIDQLAKPVYGLLKFLKWRPQTIPEKPKFVVLKFFGLGSITRIAHVMEATGIAKEDVLFVTLSKNKSIIELIDLNVIYVKSNHLFQFIGSTLSIIFRIWRMKQTVILDMERTSNLSGIFRLIIGINKACRSFNFEHKNTINPTQSFISLSNKSATIAIAEMFDRTYVNPQNLTTRRTKAHKILINVNAGNYLPQRKFTLPEYAEVIKLLSLDKPDWHFHLSGLKSEVSYVETFRDMLIERGLPQSKISVLAGERSLDEFVDDLKSSQLFITNDSGPLHFARYYSVKTIGIWGPTSHLQVGYSNDSHMLNIQTDIACSPCFIHPKSKVAKECHGQLTCFRQMVPSEVVSKILKFAKEAS